jgi:PEST, proteolytic signal-containing nuclear protein family
MSEEPDPNNTVRIRNTAVSPIIIGQARSLSLNFSIGPNSFGKTKRGFTDTNKLFEKQLKEAMDAVSNDNRDRTTKLKK